MMWRAVLATAGLTGAFCMGFAWVVDIVTDALPMGTALMLAFVSGFLGSLFAQLVLRRRA